MGKSSFEKESNKIISNLVNDIDIREPAYVPDVNKFTDWLKFCELYPGGNYSQFRKYCQKKNKRTGDKK